MMKQYDNITKFVGWEYKVNRTFIYDASFDGRCATTYLFVQFTFITLKMI